MISLKNWRILTGSIAFLLLVAGILNDLPTTARANFLSPAPPANSPANLPDKAGEIAGTPWQGPKAVVVPTRQIGGPNKNSPKPARPRPILPIRGRNTSTGQSATSTATVQSKLFSTSPSAVSPSLVSTFPTVDLTFTGTPLQADLDVNGDPFPQIIPPDIMGAVGPTQYLMAINGLLRVYNKATGVPEHPFGDFDPDLDFFFSPVMTPNDFNYTNFPRVRYDRFSSRWILLVNDVPGGLATIPNRILLAVSDGPEITQNTIWSEYYIQPELLLPTAFQSVYADYPTLGIDANALYIGVNLYTLNSAPLNTAGFVVKKSSILNGGPIMVTGFAPLQTGSGPSLIGPLTPQGVDNLDSSVSEGYFIGINVSNTGSSRLYLRRVSDPGGTPTISDNIAIPIDLTARPIPVPHKDNTGDEQAYPDKGKLDPVDDRLINAVIRNGSLWTAHNIGVNSSGDSTGTPDRDGSRWYEITLDTSPSPDFSVLQSGTVYDPTTGQDPKSYWLPSIMVSGQGHTVIGHNVAGSNDYISAAVTGRLKNDAPNLMQPTILYTTSISAYNPPTGPENNFYGRRWGDYSYTSLDPEDDMTFWTIQEFAYNNNNYGTKIAKLKAPPPATPVSSSAVLPPGQSSVNVTINGTSTNGSGFFDPGPGFAKRLNVYIDGEILVNSISSVITNSITLNVSTVFATTGAHSVTITNPDGQTITVPGIINVKNYSCTQPVTSSNDSGSNTLREAIGLASSGCKTIILNVSSPIILNSSLTISTPGVTITTNKVCSDINTVEIVGTNINGDGLTLNGGIFFGIKVHGFMGRQIVANQGNNQMKCVSVSTA